MSLDLVGARIRAPVVTPFPDAAEEVLHMGIGHGRHIRLVLCDEVLHRGGEPVPIERSPTVGEQHERHTSAAQHAMDLVQHGERVGEVLEDVTGDHEVLALVVERLQTVGVEIRDDVGHREGGFTELGEQIAVGVGHPPIDVADVGTRVRDREGRMSGSQLDPVADEVARQQSAQRSPIQRAYSHHHSPECSGGPSDEARSPQREIRRAARPLRLPSSASDAGGRR